LVVVAAPMHTHLAAVAVGQVAPPHMELVIANKQQAAAAPL